MKRFVALCLMAVAFATAPAFSADYDKGLDAYFDGNYVTAFSELQPFAEQGNVIAQFALGFMYDNGFGVPQDYKEAFKWYKLSAEQGDKIAQNNLGTLYDDGTGVPQDYKQAVEWYRLSAEQGYEKAQTNIGAKYYKGEGVPQDYLRAHMWSNLGASGGNKESTENRDIIAEGMTPSQIDKAQDLARKCLANNYQGC